MMAPVFNISVYVFLSALLTWEMQNYSVYINLCFGVGTGMVGMMFSRIKYFHFFFKSNFCAIFFPTRVTALKVI